MDAARWIRIRLTNSNQVGISERHHHSQSKLTKNDGNFSLFLYNFVIVFVTIFSLWVRLIASQEQFMKVILQGESHGISLAM